MKRMSCEVCGCTDIVKDGDFFVCQACGCKYKADDVKKLIVDISGSSVNVSNTEEVSESISNKISNDKSYKGIIACSVVNIVLVACIMLCSVFNSINIPVFSFVTILIAAEAVFNIIKPQKAHFAFGVVNIILCFIYVVFYGKTTNSYEDNDGCLFIFLCSLFLLLFINAIVYIIKALQLHGKK